MEDLEQTLAPCLFYQVWTQYSMLSVAKLEETQQIISRQKSLSCIDTSAFRALHLLLFVREISTHEPIHKPILLLHSEQGPSDWAAVCTTHNVGDALYDVLAWWSDDLVCTDCATRSPRICQYFRTRGGQESDDPEDNSPTCEENSNPHIKVATETPCLVRI